MALTQIEVIRMLVGDTPSSPFYPVLSDEQIQALIDTYGPSNEDVARWAAISIAGTVAGYNSREITGDIHVYNEYGRNYLAFLKELMRGQLGTIPKGLMPWSASVGSCSKLMNIQVCDHEETCGCTDCNKTGDVFAY